jgi:transglutaminase-like putative cysteine protease
LAIRVGCEFTWRPEILTEAVFQVEPRPDGPQLVCQEWATEPMLRSRCYTDRFGNICRRMELPPGKVTIRYDALAVVDDAIDDADQDAVELAPQDLPDDVISFTLPSRFCHPELLADAAWQHFGAMAPGYRRVQAICQFVHDHVKFQAGASSPTTTAVDIYRAQTGVCRDFAHLMITFCRALNIPARYAFGYLPDIGVPVSDDPMDFCAWTEIFLGGRWYTFDPRNNARRAGRVLIGRGRDAVDVAMVTAIGGAELVTMLVWAQERTEAAG